MYPEMARVVETRVVAQISEAYAHVVIDSAGDSDGDGDAEDGMGDGQWIQIAIADKEQARCEAPDDRAWHEDETGNVRCGKENCRGQRRHPFAWKQAQQAAGFGVELSAVADAAAPAIADGVSIDSSVSCGKRSRMNGMSIAPSTLIHATCIPCGPRSRAITCASPRIANFAGPNAAEVANGFTPAVAPVNTIVPARFATIAGTTCCAARNAPNAHTRQVFSKVLGLVSISLPNGRIAAL